MLAIVREHVETLTCILPPTKFLRNQTLAYVIWANHFILLYIYFPICKMEIIMR